ncbi:hypothetical protein P9265_06040 [Schinkia azotoformans]|uniref:hypothetical protein n=1 Tax=Schinkia azotoformans TaxID=1454 RepID=UPI002E24D53A|nr:hypothetical protein [Schinkia azotoformans]
MINRKRVIFTILALVIPISASASVYASGNEGDDANSAMTLLNKGNIVELENKNLELESSDFKTLEFSYSTDSLNGDTSINATWDGSFSNSYTIPKLVVAGGSSSIVAWLLSKTTWPTAICTGIASAIGVYTSDDVTVKSTVNYRWITKYTECYYSMSSNIYVDGKFKKTITQTWTAKDDPNIDSIDPTVEVK